jgi:ribosomal protein S18 acetylase RimI-like enzyme
MLQLVLMTETEFQAYRAADIAEYAQEHVKAGRWRPEESLHLAEQEFNDLLPDGLATPNQYLFSLKDEALGTQVGRLWFAVRDEGSKPTAFVFNIVIFEAFRRHGYGTQAMQTLEEKVRELGLSTISLHVFGHNHIARAMYEKLGYVTTNVMMSKLVKPQGD